MSKSGLRLILLRYFKFAVSTLAGTAVDMFVLWLCSSVFLSSTYSMNYLLAPCLSFECAVLTNFTLAYFVVWRDRIEIPSTRSFFAHFPWYNLSCRGAFLVKMAILLTLEWLFHWNVLLCNITALCFSGIINFLMNDKAIFTNREQKQKGKRNLVYRTPINL